MARQEQKMHPSRRAGDRVAEQLAASWGPLRNSESWLNRQQLPNTDPRPRRRVADVEGLTAGPARTPGGDDGITVSGFRRERCSASRYLAHIWRALPGGRRGKAKPAKPTRRLPEPGKIRHVRREAAPQAAPTIHGAKKSDQHIPSKESREVAST